VPLRSTSTVVTPFPEAATARPTTIEPEAGLPVSEGG
jgi:hypothetical protein